MNAPLLSPDAVTSLLSWFEKEGKTYPWGEKTTPYRVWVSEIMLQQTVVTAVIPYFTRWMERFPNPLALAEAEEEEVLRYWEGLGYYSRGRNLLKAARTIRDRLGGELPGDLEGWKALPGVGEYTARAVLSIALGRPYPVLDANVRRIGQRLLGRRFWPAGADRELMTALEQSIPPREPGKFNAALMQLGQLVCRTGAPLCSACPLRQGCTAAAEGTAAEIPQRKSRSQIVLYSRRFVISREGRILMIRRNHGIGRGLWVLPGTDAGGALRAAEAAGVAGVTEAAAPYGGGLINVEAEAAAGRPPATEGAEKTDAALAAAETAGPYGFENGASGDASDGTGAAGLRGDPVRGSGSEPVGSPGGESPPEADPRGFPRGTDEVFIQMVKKITPIELKPRRHTYTRYREELSVEAVIWEAPGGGAGAGRVAEAPRKGPGAEAGLGFRAAAGGMSEPEGEIQEQLEKRYADSGWDARWFSLEEIGRLPLPAVYRKIMDEVRG